MGIRLSCPNGHKLNVKTHLAGKRGVCPKCGAKFVIPASDGSPDFDTGDLLAAGQSHSVEVMAPVVSQTTSAIASPSVIIPVEDTTTPAAETVRSTEIPTSIVAAPAEPQPQKAPAVAASQNQSAAAQRNRARRIQVVISLFLFATVIVLGVVLVIVMKRHWNEASTAPAAAPATAAPAPASP